MGHLSALHVALNVLTNHTHTREHARNIKKVNKVFRPEARTPYLLFVHI